MRKFGLIGKTLDHSFSESYFREKFANENINDADYSLFPLERIEAISGLFAKQDLNGLNVTIPYKEQVIPYLDEIDLVAEQIGAINTIQITKGFKKGFNTDYLGFQKSIRPFLAKEHSRALILGTGGASKAISYVLEQMGIGFYYCSQSKKTESNIIHYSDVDDELVSRFPLIINCSPMGTFPDVDKTPPIPLKSISKQHLVYDLIYNPAESKLLQISKAQGALACNGLNMLKIQAEESWKIWNS